MDTDRDLAVDLRAGNLFKNRSSVIGWCLEECGKATLGQQHGSGKPIKVHAGSRLNLICHPSDLGLENLA